LLEFAKELRISATGQFADPLGEYLLAGVVVEFAGEEIGGVGCAAAERLPCGVRVRLRAEVIVVRFLILAPSRKLSRSRMAGGEFRFGTDSIYMAIM
jgi:hypothetical protein